MILADSNAAPLLLIPLAIGIYVLSIKFLYWRTDQIMRRWCCRTGCRILAREYRWVARGPFWLTTSNGRSVYRIRAVDERGILRTGWMRIGGWFLGILSDHVQVIWDEKDEGFPVILKESQRDEDGTKTENRD